MKAKTIGYWTTTAIIAFVLLSGGAAELAHRPETIEGMAHLGYPLYTAHLLWPLLFAILTLASWALRPQSRILGTLFPARTPAEGRLESAGLRSSLS
jgi:hypothetical protein